MVPRAMLFAVMPWRATSLAMARENPAAPALAALYAAICAPPLRAASETIVMMRPHPRSIIAGSAAWVQLMTPWRFTAR